MLKCSIPRFTLEYGYITNEEQKYSFLTFYFQTSDLFLHLSCVDLAHVASAVFFLHLFYDQTPSLLFVMGYFDSSIMSNHFLVQCENGLITSLYPSNLNKYVTNIMISYLNFGNLIIYGIDKSITVLTDLVLIKVVYLTRQSCIFSSRDSYVGHLLDKKWLCSSHYLIFS